MDITDIKLNRVVYYANKPTFTKLLKKHKLKWKSAQINKVSMEGWFNDTQEHVQKLPEEGDFKRFRVIGCLEISEYLISLSRAQPQPRTFIAFPTELPWQLGESWEYRKKQLLDAWDLDFKVRWT